MTTVRARSQSVPILQSGAPLGGDDSVKEIEPSNHSPTTVVPGPKELPNDDLKAVNIVQGKIEEDSGKVATSRRGDYSGHGHTPPEPTFGDKVAQFFKGIGSWFASLFTKGGKEAPQQKKPDQAKFHHTDPTVQKILYRNPGANDARLLLDRIARSIAFAPDSALASAIRATEPYHKLLKQALDVLDTIRDKRREDVGNDFDIAEFRIRDKDRKVLQTLHAWDQGIRESMEECGLTKLWGLDTRSG